jgi:hypothetical protein
LKVWFSLASLVAGLVACSPALNWRTVQPVEGLELLLPCKPSQRQEQVQLGMQATQLSMLGCRAQDMDFTHSVMTLPSGMSADELISQWQRASLNPLGSLQSQALQPQTLKGLAQPAVSLRVKTSAGLQAHMLWWHQGQQVHQLAVYGPAQDQRFDESVDAFVASVKHKP